MTLSSQRWLLTKYKICMTEVVHFAPTSKKAIDVEILILKRTSYWLVFKIKTAFWTTRNLKTGLNFEPQSTCRSIERIQQINIAAYSIKTASSSLGSELIQKTYRWICKGLSFWFWTLRNSDLILPFFGEDIGLVFRHIATFWDILEHFETFWEILENLDNFL